MHRATPNTTSLRTHTAGGARATVANMENDTALMQACTADFSANETRSAIEAAQNYGFTSHNHSRDDSGSAETFVNFMGGGRGFPTAGPCDDRRHRLRGLDEGDTAIHRGKDDDMQTHFAGDGMYHSAPQQVRMQLVPSGSGKANAPQKKPQATTAANRAKIESYAKYGPRIEIRLWAGLEPEIQLELDRDLERRFGVEAFAGNGGGGSGGGGSGGGGQQQGGKKTGQKAVKDKGADSPDFCHVKKGEARMSSAKQVRLSTSKEDDDVLHEASGGKNWVGGTPAKHKFAKILTLAGPSINGFGRIG
jgi:phage gp45-like